MVLPCRPALCIPHHPATLLSYSKCSPQVRHVDLPVSSCTKSSTRSLQQLAYICEHDWHEHEQLSQVQQRSAECIKSTWISSGVKVVALDPRQLWSTRQPAFFAVQDDILDVQVILANLQAADWEPVALQLPSIQHVNAPE